jgi:hypothetical protein
MTINELKDLMSRKISYLGSCIASAEIIGDIERTEALETELADTVDALAQLNTL